MRIDAANPRLRHDGSMVARLSRAAVELTAPGEVRVRRALLSVSDKRGLVDFARGLAELGVEIVSTGGTAARAWRGEGIEVRAVEDYTGFPEILDGRVKTLNPRIYAGLLAVRSNADHVDTLNEHEIEPIDLVCVNLYPFERVSSQRGRRGRRGDREHRHRRADADPRGGQEPRVRGGGGLAGELRRGARGAARERRPAVVRARARALAMEAFAYTARYDSGDLALVRRARGRLPGRSTRARTRRCSTSPTARTRTSGPPTTRRPARARTCCRWSRSCTARSCPSTTCSTSTRGAGWSRTSSCRRRRSSSTTTPAARRSARASSEAFDKALATDPQSAFGGVFCFNRPVDRALAEKLHAMFVELVFAPGYDEDALEVLEQKPNVRILENQERRRAHDQRARHQAGARRAAGAGPRHRASSCARR